MKIVMLIVHIISIALFIGSLIPAIFSYKKNNISFLRIIVVNKALTILRTITFLLLILSGGYLMTPYWVVLGAFPMLHIKFTLIILMIPILIMNVNVQRKVRIVDADAPLIYRSRSLQLILFVMALLSIVFAVATFQ